jgi:hypothetical protein
MMNHAESLKVLPCEQYGSCKHLHAVIVALNKRLTFDLLRQRQQAGAFCANDAKLCYNWMVHSMMTLSMRRLGVAKDPILSMFKLLQGATHKIRTAYGDSTKTYGQNHMVPLQTIGQGNGCGPAVYAALSAVLIDMMKTMGFGFHMMCALSATLIHFVCYVFVDDADIIHTTQDVNTAGKQIITKMQEVIDHWEGRHRAMGGAIEPLKSYWYLIDWEWDNKAWHHCNMTDMPGSLTIQNVSGDARVILPWYGAWHTQEMVGILLAPDGNNAAQIRKLRFKAEEFADHI